SKRAWSRTAPSSRLGQNSKEGGAPRCWPPWGTPGSAVFLRACHVSRISPGCPSAAGRLAQAFRFAIAVAIGDAPVGTGGARAQSEGMETVPEPFVTRLRDGLGVQVRALGPEDREAMREGLTHVGGRSLYERFLS